MLDPSGFVATCNSTNFFICRDGEVLAPSPKYQLHGTLPRPSIAADTHTYICTRAGGRPASGLARALWARLRTRGLTENPNTLHRHHEAGDFGSVSREWNPRARDGFYPGRRVRCQRGFRHWDVRRGDTGSNDRRSHDWRSLCPVQCSACVAARSDDGAADGSVRRISGGRDSEWPPTPTPTRLNQSIKN